MYVISRHEGEDILMISGKVRIKVLNIMGKTVRLGFDAPKEVDIVRVKTSTGDAKNDRKSRE